MNTLYFACLDCKIIVNAGYRWCYSKLEKPGIVERNRPLDVKRILRTSEFWSVDESPESDWLRLECLPAIREFLVNHETHRLTFLEEGDFDHIVPDGWMQIGYRPWPTPRLLIEVVGIKSWEHATAWLSQQDAPYPGWWQGETIEDREHFRLEFERLIAL